MCMHSSIQKLQFGHCSALKILSTEKNRDKKKDRKERRQERKDRKNRRSGKCRYNAGVWEDCVEGMRTMTQTLAKGNPDLCEPEKIRTAPCVNKKGEG